jgi:hypothetical protein
VLWRVSRGAGIRGLLLGLWGCCPLPSIFYDLLHLLLYGVRKGLLFLSSLFSGDTYVFGELICLSSEGTDMEYEKKLSLLF